MTNAPVQRRIKGAFVAPTPTLPILTALDFAYTTIRTKHPEVAPTNIVVGASSQKNHGHFQAGAWHGKATSEIFLSGETLRRGAADVFATLLHEAVHASAHAQGIKDTSRNGRYHNTKYKLLAESFGLVAGQTEKYGYTDTYLSKEALKLYAPEISMLNKALKAYRIPVSVEKAPRVPKTVKLRTKSGRTVTVPIIFHEAGDIFDAATGEKFVPVDNELTDYEKEVDLMDPGVWLD